MITGQVGLKVLVGASEPRLSAITGDLAAAVRISTARRLAQQMLDDYRPFAGFDDEPPPAAEQFRADTAAVLYRRG